MILVDAALISHIADELAFSHPNLSLTEATDQAAALFEFSTEIRVSVKTFDKGRMSRSAFANDVAEALRRWQQQR